MLVPRLPVLRFGLLASLALLLAGFFHNSPKPIPESAALAKEVPIADLHLHPMRDLPAEEAKARMDANGVRWAGAGAQGPRPVWLGYSQVLGDRFIPFAGQGELNGTYQRGGLAAMEDAENPAVKSLLAQAESDFKEGRIKGIGEMFVNNSNTNANPRMRRRSRADAPPLQALYRLAALHGGFLTFHMEGDAENLAQMEALLASDRKGRILWNHCGSRTGADEVRPLLARNPNLFCELSYRFPPVLKERQMARYPESKIFDASGPEADWLKLIEEFPDRFMVGTDADSREDYDGAIRTIREGLLPYLRPETARKVAHGNAQRLFGLK